MPWLGGRYRALIFFSDRGCPTTAQHIGYRRPRLDVAHVRAGYTWFRLPCKKYQSCIPPPEKCQSYSTTTTNHHFGDWGLYTYRGSYVSSRQKRSRIVCVISMIKSIQNIKINISPLVSWSAKHKPRLSLPLLYPLLSPRRLCLTLSPTFSQSQKT